MSPNIEYQQIEIKPGAKGYNYRVIKKVILINLELIKIILKLKIRMILMTVQQ